MSKKTTGLANIDSELYEICKDMNITFNPKDSLSEGHLISNNTIMVGSIFPHGKYENTEGYSNKDDGSFEKLLNYVLEQ